jgi:hypothetical protein
MGLIDKVKPQQTQNNTNPAPQNELNVKELEFLLLLIKQSDFKGEDVELIYNTVLKLQNQYLKQIPK